MCAAGGKVGGGAGSRQRGVGGHVNAKRALSPSLLPHLQVRIYDKKLLKVGVGTHVSRGGGGERGTGRE